MKRRKDKLRERKKNRPKTLQKSKKKKRIAPVQSPADDLRSLNGNAKEAMEIMSHVILDFAKPLLETCNDRTSEKKAISLAVYVWNATLFPKERQKQMLDDYLSKSRKVMSAEDIKTLSDYIYRLVDDKNIRFSEDRRRIINCTFGDYEDETHIEIGYTME